MSRILQEVNTIIGAAPGISELSQKIFKAVMAFLGAERGLLLRREKDMGAGRWGQWELSAARGMDEEMPGSSAFKPYAQIISAVEKKGETLLVTRRAWKVIGLRPDRASEKRLPGFLVCLPMKSRGKLLGILYADGVRKPAHVTARSVPVLAAFADQVGTAIENSSLYSEISKAKERTAEKALFVGGDISRGRRFGEIIGFSDAMRGVLHLVEKAAKSNSTVLLQGETGSGKEIIARAIHYNGPRRGSVFMAQNCAALPEALLESELFGHAKGAFTGAVADKKGLLEMADGGTVFLDEIADASLVVQAKLLRILQDGIIRPLGSNREIKVDVRIISATNRNLGEEVKKGNFREDLFYRLNVFPVKLPPLRDRKKDIPQLAMHFLRLYSEKAGKEIRGFSNEAVRLLMDYRFPGNVRELENEVERIVAMHHGGKIVTAAALSEKIREGIKGDLARKLTRKGATLREALKEVERDIIIETLKSCNGNVTQAARRLGLSRYGLYKKMSEHGISSSQKK